jgi:predicted ATPase
VPFTVVPPRGSIAAAYGAPFILRRDNWNDFGYQTLYQLYSALNQSEPTLIGDVKILKKGQTAADGHRLEDGTFIELDDSFCSMGQSLDYYERLANLSPDIRDMALHGLRDIVRYPNLSEGFRKEEGWSTSLFRYISENDDFIEIARTLLDRDYTALPAVSVAFTLEIPGWLGPITFRFDSPQVESRKEHTFFADVQNEALPARIAVLIGRNGSGKSTLLARLARIAHASRWERKTKSLQSLGHLVPEGIGFTRVFAISYSAFDSFVVPGLNRRDREQIARDIEEGSGRYIFCGLRDIVRELREELSKTSDSETLTESTTEIELVDRTEHTLLKPLEQIASEFVHTLQLIENKNRIGLLSQAVTPILGDPSFNDLPTRTISSLFDSDRHASFMSWSTGHKIVMHVIAFLVAHTERKSLVLFDEPEAHLHPPLLAALMHGVRLVLERNDAFAIVSTHAPVVIQETLARHVHLIVREGGSTMVKEPSIQTFGENIGLLTSEVFELTSTVTDYHAILAKIADRYENLEQIEALFDGQLSMQARAYVMSTMSRKERTG